MAKKNFKSSLGLETIMGDAPEKEEKGSFRLLGNISTSADITDIPLSEIYEGDNVRKKYKHIDELADSIKASGLIQPITVVKKRKGYLLIAGHRRIRAFQQLGRSKIKTYIHKEIKDVEMAQLIENLQRDNLPPEDTETAIVNIIEKGTKQNEVAAKLGKSKGWVSQVVSSAVIREKFRRLNFHNHEKLAALEEVGFTSLYELGSKIKDDELLNKSILKLLNAGGSFRTARLIAAREIKNVDRPHVEITFENKLNRVENQIRKLFTELEDIEYGDVAALLKNTIDKILINKGVNI